MDSDPRRKPDSRTCEHKALSERDSCVGACAFLKCALKPCISAWVNQRARTAHYEQNITSQCADPDRDSEGVCNACERT